MEISPKENEAAPWERTYHVAELFYPYLVVFGGESVTDLEDLWVFNFINLSWKEIKIPKESIRPCARRFHSSTKINNEMFVIAGCHSKYRCLNDVYSLDVTTLLETGSIDKLEWKERKFMGSAFLTRWGHSSVTHNNKIYIFGGRFSNDLNDLIMIDISKNIMKSLKITQEIPKARRRHSAVFLGSCMIIFGGFNGDYFNDMHYINLLELKRNLTSTIEEREKQIFSKFYE